jgi:vancomycin resistance protein YoaR
VTDMRDNGRREKAGGRVVVLTVLGLAFLVGAAWTAAYVFAGDKLPRGSTVAGIELGGREPGAAERLLRDTFERRESIEVTVDGRRTVLDASETGLSIDAAATVAEAGGGRSWRFGRLWDYYTGGDDLTPVVVRDDAAFVAALGRLDEQFGTPPREGDVTFTGGEVHGRPGRAGKEIDRASALQALETAYLTGGKAELSLTTAEPEISEADVQQAMNEFGNAAVSGPVTLVFDTHLVKLQPADYAPALGMEPKNGVLVPELDEKKLDALVRHRITGLDGAPVDATVRIVHGRPKVIPAKAGIDYLPSDISSAFLDLVVRQPGRREMAVKATVQQADFSTAEARKLKIVEKVSSFTTYYPHEDYRNTNIGRAAELVNGTVLRPGETFSLNDTVGERTKKNGFTTGYIINDGVLERDLGGGVSQMATTTFNAMFFAGLQDVEHKTHSFYIDRYPVGREATVAWGSVDLRFKNTTPYGVLFQAHVTPSAPGGQGVVTVSMWSTKYWDITTKTGERYKFTPPETRTMYGDSCVPNSGYGGFDINIWRYFRKAGSPELVKTEKMHTTYIPSDTVICKPAPPSEAPTE